MKTLSDITLNEEQTTLACSIINNLGDGQHPVADENTLKYFTIDYLSGLFPLAESKMTNKGKETIASIRTLITNLN